MIDFFANIEYCALLKEGNRYEQINLLVEYCNQNRPGKYGVYSDKGSSGTNMKRTRLNRLLEDIKDHEINIVLAYRLDGIFRR